MVTQLTYIITAEFDEVSFAWLDRLRQAHFPAARNFLQAHLTLFHKVRNDDIEAILRLALPKAALPVRFTQMRFLGAGVAIEADVGALTALRRSIEVILTQVSSQDSQGWRPHITIQNKVAPNDARRLFKEMAKCFRERSGSAVGLLIWEYQGGPWRLVRRLPFA